MWEDHLQNGVGFTELGLGRFIALGYKNGRAIHSQKISVSSVKSAVELREAVATAAYRRFTS